MVRASSSLIIVCALLLAACNDAPSKPRKQQTVKLLPDTPPPPPPPPPPRSEEPKPQAKADNKPPPDSPKPVDAPLQQVLKTDEEAGDGPGSGLASGSVTNDYQGGPVGAQVGGGSLQSAQEAVPNRLVLNTYAQAATRSLNEFLVRDRDVKRLDYKVRIDLWLNADGSYQRAELVGSTSDPATDQALRIALGRFPGSGDPLPPRMPQPLRVLVSNRLMG